MHCINRLTSSTPGRIQATSRRRASIIGVVSLGLGLWLPVRATAATATRSLTVSATADEAYSLIIGGGAAAVTSGAGRAGINGARTLKLEAPTEAESPISVTVKARVSAQTRVLLTVMALDDLKSSTGTVSCRNVNWTAQGNGFQGGTLSKTAPQTIGAWTGSGIQNGSISYAWVFPGDYAPGSYTTTVIYSLVAP